MTLFGRVVIPLIIILLLAVIVLAIENIRLSDDLRIYKNTIKNFCKGGKVK